MLRRLALGALFGGAIAIPVACAATSGGGSQFGEGGAGGEDDTTTSGPGTGGAGPASQTSSTTGGDFIDGGLGTGGSDGGSPPLDDCAEAAKLIYIVGETYELYSYDPPTKELKQVGMLACPAGGFATPFSMAVDRSATAWVLYSNGTIWHVDIKNGAKCSPTNFVPNQSGFTTFGMGFVSDDVGSQDETLYVGNYTGQNLGKINPKTMVLTPVANYNGGGGLNGPAEITGTGDARLFGFFANLAQGNTSVAEIDKATATMKSVVSLPNINVGSGWAFAFWGGSFYLFTAPTGNSQITKLTLDPADPNMGTTQIEVPSVGFVIVGAGVSTCAPTVEPPK
jgi:hypothetical protein